MPQHETKTKCANSREPEVLWSCPHRCLFRASAPTLAGKWSSPCLFAQCVLALSPVWFSALVSSTGPGRLYSAGPGSPPGLGDLTRASSLTNKQCVGLREKPPRRCQNKSRYRTSTFRKTLKITDCELICFLVNLIKYLKRLDWKKC